METDILTNLEDWFEDRRKRSYRLISSRPASDEEKRRWKEEWDRHDEVVYALIGEFSELGQQWLSVMEAGYELASFNLFNTGHISPKDHSEVTEWAVHLWERIHNKTGIAIPDMKRWDSEAKRLWLG